MHSRSGRKYCNARSTILQRCNVADEGLDEEQRGGGGGGDAVPILRKNCQIFLKHMGVDITCFLDAKSSLTKRNRTSETSKLELFTKKVNGLLPNCQLSQKVSP